MGAQRWLCCVGTRLLPCGFPSQVRADRAAGSLGRLWVLWGPQHCGHEWGSGLLEKEANPPVTRISLQETSGGGWPPQGSLHLHRSCYWRWSPGRAGTSPGWPGVSHWRGWRPCSPWWAAGNLGSNPLRASAQDHGWWGWGALDQEAHLQRRPREAAPRPRWWDRK